MTGNEATEGAKAPGDREFRVHVEIEPRFRDTDAMGHVNNAVYVTYLEVARQEYWKRIQPDYGTVPFVIAHINLDLLSPLKVGEKLRIGLRTSWMSRSSFQMDYELTETISGREVARAHTIKVAFDWKTERAMPIPEWLRNKLEEIEGPLPGKPTE